MAELKVFTDGAEAYVAESIEHTRQLQEEHTGDVPTEQSEWYEVTRSPLTIDTDTDRGEVTQTLAEWIAESGPGFLFSSEY